MKQQLQKLINKALTQLQKEGSITLENYPTITIERARDSSYGDFACNIALMLAKPLGMSPRDLAEKIVSAIPGTEFVSKVEIAGPGFINFFLTQNVNQQIVKTILQEKNNYGRASVGAGKKIHLEIISANPTGPLHVGHGRLAAYGATVGNLLEAVGYTVHREYYVNDSGRQMRILATSIWLRYLELFGEKFPFPNNAYKGDYIIDIAKQLKINNKKKYLHSAEKIFSDIPKKDDDKEAYIDIIINKARDFLGETDFKKIRNLGLDSILTDIKNDLDEFGVIHQEWYLESRLSETGVFNEVVDNLKQHGTTYEKDSAIWFRATQFGDEKDRVVLRENGEPTYFAADIAYHLTKLERGFDKLIDIFGADHHGYVPRMNAFFQAIGKDPKLLSILLIQFAILYRGKEKVSMSTRSGSFVTLRELRKEVGNDAARFFYIMRKREQHLDFDLELAKSRSADNPVYYIQYAHARICSVMNQLNAKQLSFDQASGLKQLGLLTTTHEQNLLRELNRYPEVVLAAASNYEPHLLANYLQKLANALHTYYNAEQFLVEADGLRASRLCLILATKQVLKNGLTILGVSAPEIM